ncbi:MAG: M3 family metallopeptidase [Bacteroidota bacterium]
MSKITAFLIALTMIVSCTTTEEDNPFMKEYQTPFGVPPFSEIENEHFLPAFEQGIKQQEEKIQEIIDNSEEPTFENTIESLEYSGTLLDKVSSVFYNFISSNTSDELQNIAQEVEPMLSNHRDNINLNTELFERVKTVYKEYDRRNLNEEQIKLLIETYDNFERNGANLPDSEKIRFREINEELSLLTLRFGQNVLGEVNNFELYIDNEEDLSGLPESAIDEAAKAAAEEGEEGKWLFTLQNPSVMPFLMYIDNRELREEMNKAYINRGNMDNEFDNKEIIKQIVELRMERAQMLDFDNHADFILEKRMAKTEALVDAFLEELWSYALPVAEKEAEILQEYIDKEGNDFDLAFWDWRYYAEKVRKEKFDLDESEIRPYFEINNVREGIFEVVEKLFGLQFVKRDDVPVYHPDATAWEVLEADGETHLGILYLDMHPRESKRPGAWMSSYRNQHVTEQGEFIHPVITVVCNFTPPSGDKPALLSFDEMVTFFHEFGHALHGLMANTNYKSLSGTNVTWDFVELPSQIMENWARHPEVLKMFAKHYETGETIPDELIEKIKDSGNFNQGFATVEYLSSAFLDMDYHRITEYVPFSVNAFEERVQQRYDMMDEIYFRHGSTHFQHVFSGGYSAGYYSYIWSGVLDADAFQAFVETGDLFDKETANRFREEILEKGGTRDAMEMYVNFRGHEPEVEPLLRQRGLIE